MVMTNSEDIGQQMVKNRVEQLVEGMELAQEVLSLDGKILANKGAIVSEQIINKLKKWEIDTVYTLLENPTNLIIDPNVQQFVSHYNQSISAVKQAFDDIRKTQEVPLDAFVATSETMTEQVGIVGNVVDLLYSFPHLGDGLYQHSVNVGVIAALIATWLKFPAETVSAISLTGLLHDIGKTQLSPELISYPYELSPEDYREYKTHALRGFELVNKLPNVAQSIARGVLEHHECIDGSGYPYGLKEQQIHPYAQIIAVADLYDRSLTIDCKPEMVVSPYTGLECLWNQVYKMNAKNCVVFRDNMTNFLSGNRVLLTDNCKGRVVFVSKDTPSRSMVQLEDGTVVNLLNEQGRRIHHILR